MRSEIFLSVLVVTWSFVVTHAAALEPAVLENDQFRIVLDGSSGAITSLLVKPIHCEMIGEPRLAANFRILLPLPDRMDHYIDGMTQPVESVTQDGNTVRIHYAGMKTDLGVFSLDLTCRITLDNEVIRFGASLRNDSPYPVAEFWYPRLGGWTDFGAGRDALVATPNYTNCAHNVPLFNGYPGSRGLGAEAAEWGLCYPGMVMPWWDLYDADTNHGLYLGYHDTTMRVSAWHTYLFPNTSGSPLGSWMTPEQAAGAPVGLVFSHVRYPYIKDGAGFDSGEFIIRLHSGDWHQGSRYYRDWFMKNFPFDKSESWLRKEGAWFTSILYQPEDKIIADYNVYDQWTRDAQERGVGCYELIGWDKGGIERDYPDYTPEVKLGDREGFQELLKNIDTRGGRCLVFGNYNIMDSCSDWYKNELKPLTHQDGYGNTPNWMAWGESTLTARQSMSVRRHVLASVVPAFEKVLADKLLDRVRDGAHGFQLDKVVVNSTLDFNPLNTLPPDTALAEGLVQAIGRLRDQCRAIRPDFCLASEAGQDRLIPYVDVFYRNVAGFDIAPLRYVFPEWTACQHISTPYDWSGINGAVATGAVICMEPDSYQNSLAAPQYQKIGEYLREVLRIRNELKDIIFLGNYLDTTGAIARKVVPVAGQPGQYTPDNGWGLQYRVHAEKDTDRRALVVANLSGQEMQYLWDFYKAEVTEADLYVPFEPVRTVKAGEALTLPGQGLHILVERPGVTPQKDIALLMKCGVGGQEVVFARDGYDVELQQGFACAWVLCWMPPFYHCRADEKEVKFLVHTPKGAEGILRLYCIDPDGMAGGRKQTVFVNENKVAELSAFHTGQWIETPIHRTDTQTGVIPVRIVNEIPGGNAVVSLIEWREN